MKKCLLILLLAFGLVPTANAQYRCGENDHVRRAYGIPPQICSYRYHSYDYGYQYDSFGRRVRDAAISIAEDEAHSWIRDRAYERRRRTDARYDRPRADEAYRAGRRNAEMTAEKRELERRKAELDQRETALNRKEEMNCGPYGPDPKRNEVRMRSNMSQRVVVTWGKYHGEINSIDFVEPGAEACVQVQPGNPRATFIMIDGNNQPVRCTAVVQHNPNNTELEVRLNHMTEKNCVPIYPQQAEQR